MIVGTDALGRGDDVLGAAVIHVINYDAPSDIEAYTQRISHTGRAGHQGLVTTMITERDGGLTRGSMLKVPPSLAVPQLGSCGSSGCAWRLWAARRSQEEASPLGAQPLPRMLERTASKSRRFHRL